jgi:hypothetical protein
MDMDMYGFATFRRCMDMDMDMLVYDDIYCLCMCDEQRIYPALRVATMAAPGETAPPPR